MSEAHKRAIGNALRGRSLSKRTKRKIARGVKRSWHENGARRLTGGEETSRESEM
jgi:hypothetical protein